jgi:hypothetical protein
MRPRLRNRQCTRGHAEHSINGIERDAESRNQQVAGSIPAGGSIESVALVVVVKLLKVPDRLLAVTQVEWHGGSTTSPGIPGAAQLSQRCLSDTRIVTCPT